MVPHLEFWENYPGLVADGLHISKNFIEAKLGGSGGSGGFDYIPVRQSANDEGSSGRYENMGAIL